VGGRRGGEHRGDDGTTNRLPGEGGTGGSVLHKRLLLGMQCQRPLRASLYPAAFNPHPRCPHHRLLNSPSAISAPYPCSPACFHPLFFSWSGDERRGTTDRRRRRGMGGVKINVYSAAGSSAVSGLFSRVRRRDRLRRIRTAPSRLCHVFIRPSTGSACLPVMRRCRRTRLKTWWHLAAACICLLRMVGFLGAPVFLRSIAELWLPVGLLCARRLPG